jgi:hypothetical protein
VGTIEQSPVVGVGLCFGPRRDRQSSFDRCEMRRKLGFGEFSQAVAGLPVA